MDFNQLFKWGRKMKFLDKVVSTFGYEKRNMSISDFGSMLFNLPSMQWKDWTIKNAVKDGYKVSSWVYRAISIITRNGASVPMVVFDNEGKILWDHPLTKLFNAPNPLNSGNAMLELILAWLNLAGEAYLFKNITGNGTAELFEISPDRLTVIQDKSDITNLIIAEKTIPNVPKSGWDLNMDTVVRIILPDPANPIRGIGPLQVAAKPVDTDVSQIEWNATAMQNRGMIDGIFSFDKDLSDDSIFNKYKKKIRERISGPENARIPLALGHNAKYQHIAMSPAEMDFLNSRKFNRDEIFIIFGVPLPLAGITDAMTYNNYAESLKILWENTIIPLHSCIADAFNQSFKKELQPGYYIGFDYSNIKALKRDTKTKADIAKIFFEMGVPVSLLNEQFELGLKEYPGWDQSHVGGQPNDTNPQVRNRPCLKMETRDAATDAALRDQLAEGILTEEISRLLQSQQETIFNALDAGANAEDALESTRSQWTNEMSRLYNMIANILNTANLE